MRATEKQINYINSLLRKADSATFFRFDKKYRAASELSVGEASRVIDWLKKEVELQSAVPETEVEIEEIGPEDDDSDEACERRIAERIAFINS